MKNVVRKYCSVLLVLWYCISVIGFDVHTCKGSGHSFLANFISGMSCSEIHPEHACHSGHIHCADDCCSLADVCCSNAAVHGGQMSSSCCTDDYQVLLLTGVQPEDAHRHYDECHCGHCPCLAAHSLPLSCASPCRTVSAEQLGGSVSWSPSHPGTLSYFGVWRI